MFSGVNGASLGDPFLSRVFILTPLRKLLACYARSLEGMKGREAGTRPQDMMTLVDIRSKPPASNDIL